MDLEEYIRDVPDFPKPGVVYKDITPLLQDPKAMRRTIDLFLEQLGNQHIDKVVGIESRGSFLQPFWRKNSMQVLSRSGNLESSHIIR